MKPGPPNAARQARLEAGAERTLEAIACTRLLNEALRAAYSLHDQLF